MTDTNHSDPALQAQREVLVEMRADPLTEEQLAAVVIEYPDPIRGVATYTVRPPPGG